MVMARQKKNYITSLKDIPNNVMLVLDTLINLLGYNRVIRRIGNNHLKVVKGSFGKEYNVFLIFCSE